MTRSAITQPSDLTLYPETYQKWIRTKQQVGKDTVLIVEEKDFFVALLDDAYKIASTFKTLIDGADYGEGFVAATYISKDSIDLLSKHLRLENITYIISYNHA